MDALVITGNIGKMKLQVQKLKLTEPLTFTTTAHRRTSVGDHIVSHKWLFL